MSYNLDHQRFTKNTVILFYIIQFIHIMRVYYKYIIIFSDTILV